MNKIVLFDLDGTLLDTEEGVTQTLKYALNCVGIVEDNQEILRSFLGPALKEQLIRVYGMDDQYADEVVSIFRERYSVSGMYQAKLYDDILELLQLLKSQGIITGVASAKPEQYCVSLMKHFGMEQYFDVIVGSSFDASRMHKSEVIEEALSRLNACDNRGSVLIIGDRFYDVEGAFACKIHCIGVTYGFGTRQELIEAGSEYVVDDVRGLIDFFTKYPYIDYRRDLKEHKLLKKLWRCIYPLFIHYGLLSMFSAVVVVFIYVLLSRDSGDITGKIISLETIPTGLAEIAAIPIMLYILKNDIQLRTGRRILGNWKTDKKRMKVPDIIFVTLMSITLSQFVSSLIDLSKISSLFPYYDTVSEQMYGSVPMWLEIVVVGVLAPVAEELVFRGLLFGRIRDYANARIALWASSIIFGIYHGNMIQFIYAALLGIALAWLYQRYDTLWASIICHMSANISALMLAQLYQSFEIFGYNIVRLGIFIFEIIVSVALIFYIRNRTEKAVAYR